MRKIPDIFLVLALAWWFAVRAGANGAMELDGPYLSLTECGWFRATAMQPTAYVGRCIEGAPPPLERFAVGAECVERGWKAVEDDNYLLQYSNGIPMWFAGALERKVPVAFCAGASERDYYGP